MDPIIHYPAVLRIDGFPDLSGFGLAVALGFLIGDFVSSRELVRRGHDPAPVGAAMIGAILGFIVGAKGYYAVLEGDWSLLLSREGLVFWGGLIGGVIGAWIALRVKRAPFWRVADVAGIGIAAGYAVGRTGCWAVGDDYGLPWDGPLATVFPEGTPPSTAINLSRQFGIDFPPTIDPMTVIAVHPTQLYEVAMGLVMFAILWRLRDHRRTEGWLLGVYGVLAGIERLIVEFFRAKDDRFFGVLTLAQVIAIGVLVAGVALMRMRRGIGRQAPRHVNSPRYP